MEDKMSRSLLFNVVFLSIALWTSTAFASARTDAIASAVNRAQVPAIFAATLYTGAANGGTQWGNGNGGNGNGYNNGGNGNGYNNGGNWDKDKYKHDHDGHDPTPEPSTILSFGAALLVGSAVLYSRRLRRRRS
jgi:hypothetical protein